MKRSSTDNLSQTCGRCGAVMRPFIVDQFRERKEGWICTGCPHWVYKKIIKQRNVKCAFLPNSPCF